jgi:hypothetical protein
MAERVLNEALHAALLGAFGSVMVANEGEPYRPVVTHDPIPQGDSRFGRKRVRTLESGEEYRVCCPKCGDKRHRLWINHRFDTDVEGIRMRFLAVCWNEHCEQQPGFWSWLRDAIRDGADRGIVYRPVENVQPTEDKPPEPVALPGACTPVHMLPPTHLAVRYLASRGFSAAELGQTWRVSWCDYSTIVPPQNRLIFPAYDYYEGQPAIMHWQARYLTEDILAGASVPRGERKYYNPRGSKPKRMLYNSWRARASNSLVVIGEGALDAIRIGANNGVALFGKDMSEAQRQQLWDGWGQHKAVIVLALDPDAQTETAKLVQKLASWPTKVVTLPLQPGEDVGGLTREDLVQRLKGVIA